MKMIAIDIDERKNAWLEENPECRQILAVYPAFYARAGYDPPWIGYFFQRDNEIVGCGGFKGRPKGGRVEISYGTFKNFEKQGVGTEICRQLVVLSKRSDPGLMITARTLIENNASVNILKRNGFTYAGIVHDDEDGDVWEWVYRSPE